MCKRRFTLHFRIRWTSFAYCRSLLSEPALEAARLRFRPILMTACSTLLGMVPLVIATGAGAAGRRALGTAVFGGLVAATVLVVFFEPLLYVVMQRLSECAALT